MLQRHRISPCKSRSLPCHLTTLGMPPPNAISHSLLHKLVIHSSTASARAVVWTLGAACRAFSHSTIGAHGEHSTAVTAASAAADQAIDSATHSSGKPLFLTLERPMGLTAGVDSDLRALGMWGAEVTPDLPGPTTWKRWLKISSGVRSPGRQTASSTSDAASSKAPSKMFSEPAAAPAANKHAVKPIQVCTIAAQLRSESVIRKRILAVAGSSLGRGRSSSGSSKTRNTNSSSIGSTKTSSSTYTSTSSSGGRTGSSTSLSGGQIVRPGVVSEGDNSSVDAGQHEAVASPAEALLCVSGTHPLRTLPLVSRFLPSSLNVLRMARQMRQAGDIPGHTQLWAVANPNTEEDACLAERKAACGATTFLTQPPFDAGSFRNWMLDAQLRGLTTAARLVIGVPIISSAANFAFWLDLCGMPYQSFAEKEVALADPAAAFLSDNDDKSEVAASLAAFRAVEEEGPDAVEAYALEYNRAMLRMILGQEGVGGLHFMPITPRSKRMLLQLLREGLIPKGQQSGHLS